MVDEKTKQNKIYIVGGMVLACFTLLVMQITLLLWALRTGRGGVLLSIPLAYIFFSVMTLMLWGLIAGLAWILLKRKWKEFCIVEFLISMHTAVFFIILLVAYIAYS